MEELQNNKRARSRSLRSSSSQGRRNKTVRLNRNNNEISYYDEKWPDKVIILITSHGGLSTDYMKKYDEGEDIIKKYKIPEGIKVDYFYASAHGKFTAYRENGAKNMFDFIKSHLSELLSDNPSYKTTVLSEYSNMMINIKDNIFNDVLNTDNKFEKILKNSMKNINYNKQTNKNKEFIQNKYNEAYPIINQNRIELPKISNDYVKGFTFKTYNENEFIPNKSFFRGIEDIILKKNVGLNKYNHAIRIMNLKNQPDILDLLQSKRYKKGGWGIGVDEIGISTQTIIDLCKEHGVKEITFIDSSCGALDGNDRIIRNIRRSLNRESGVNFLLNKTRSRKSARSSQK